MKSVSSKRNRAIAYANGVAHSSIRGEVRKMSTATIRQRPNQMSCRCQIVATNVGMSVWPAEYSAASPYSASNATDATSALSSWRTRDSTVDRNHGRETIGQHGDLERRGRRVRRDGHAQSRGSGFLEAESVCDRAADDRDLRGAVLAA